MSILDFARDIGRNVDTNEPTAEKINDELAIRLTQIKYLSF